MRLTFALMMLFGVAAAWADEEYRTARVVDAGAGTELQSDGAFGGVSNANVHTITIDLDGMRYTAEYQTLTPGGKNSSTQFVVGTEVQAYVHNDRQLWILREDGTPLKIRITRRELLSSPAAE
jgi:hypothetical protein